MPLIKTLQNHAYSNIYIIQIVNYLETLDYNLNKINYLGLIISKNERLAKYFFLETNQASESSLQIRLYTYVKFLTMYRLEWVLVITCSKKGFCCIRLSGDWQSKTIIDFLYSPNILSGSLESLCDSIYEDHNYWLCFF